MNHKRKKFWIGLKLALKSQPRNNSRKKMSEQGLQSVRLQLKKYIISKEIKDRTLKVPLRKIFSRVLININQRIEIKIVNR